MSALTAEPRRRSAGGARLIEFPRCDCGKPIEPWAHRGGHERCWRCTWAVRQSAVLEKLFNEMLREADRLKRQWRS